MMKPMTSKERIDAVPAHREAYERIEAAKGRGYILAPGCDMGADTPPENVKMLAKACMDKGASV